MSRVVKIEILETSETLLKRLKKAKLGEHRDKIQALYLLKTKSVETVQYLAVILGCHRTTVQRWLREYRTGGLEAMLYSKPKPGRKPSIPQSVRERLAQELNEPQGFESYLEVQTWLQTTQGISASYKVVHHTIRYQMQAKLKVPRPTSSQQESGAIDDFKKN